MSAPWPTDEIRDNVRARYAASAARIAARQAGAAAPEQSSCCAPGVVSAPVVGAQADSCSTSCCGPATPGQSGPEPFYGAQLYDPAEAAGAPAAAVEASLGCGVPTAVADLKPGEIVLDLGSGAGADVLISARRVAPGGRAYGLDMTPEMLQLARDNAAAAGVDNVEFLQGYLEDIPLPDAGVDVVISNCVINLAADKTVVLREAARVLRAGGRLAVSDVIADADMDPQVRADADSWTGCVAGALTRAEFAAALTAAGFVDIDITDTHRVHEHASAAIVRAVRAAGSGQVSPAWVPVAACTLPTAEQPARLREFDELFRSVRAVDRVSPTRLRLLLAGAAGVAEQARDLAARETSCCSFFAFTVTTEPDGVVIDVQVPAERAGVLDGIARQAAAGVA